MLEMEKGINHITNKEGFMKEKEKVALVTGGARGIGKAICTRLARSGMKVVVADVQAELAEETSRELNEAGYSSVAYRVDLSSTDEIHQMFAYVKETFGGLDVLVNNAGIQIRCASVNFTEEDWDRICGVNLKAQWTACQCAARMMLPKGKGKIICIASGTATRATSQRSPYNITKAAVEGLARALGNEWARYGIYVNAVSPGWTGTEMVKDGLKVGIIDESEILPMMPIRRFLKPEEIANTVNFLASDESDGIVGQTIYCDGGGSIRCIPEPDFSLEIK